MSDVDTGEGYVCVGERGIWEISAPFSLFYCKPKTALFKTKVFFKGIIFYSSILQFSEKDTNMNNQHIHGRVK